MHPLLVLIGLVVASSFAVMLTMRREKIEAVDTVTALMGVLGIPIIVFIILAVAQRLS